MRRMGHGAAEGDGSGKVAIIAAFLANLGIAISKFVAFAFTGSTSMLAEGIHSVADTGNQALLLLGGRRARRPADAEHPFGFGAERYFWAFVVAVVLFTLGSAFAIIEGIEKLIHPHEIESAVWAIGVLLLAMVMESFSLRTALREATPMRRGRSIPRFIRETKAPELPVVLLEDAAALCGLWFALIAVVLAEVFHEPRWDALGTLAIGLLLGFVAVVLAIEMKSLLIGESASPATTARIRGALEGHDAVARLITLRTLHLGPDDLLVAAKIEFVRGLSDQTLASEVDSVEAAVRAEVPTARVILIEPDVYREPA
jgi:cation diffusion facilitator family transporter